MGRMKSGKRGRGTATRSRSVRTYADCLQQALRWFTREHSFTNLTLHGNVGWRATQLIGLVVLWVWSDQRTLGLAFRQAHELAHRLFGTKVVGSYQGMMGALRRYSARLLPELSDQLHGLMERSAGSHWRLGPWLALAVDGSRVTTPRTASNERAFAALNYGQGGRARYRSKWKNKRRRSKPLGQPVKPQIWLTLVWHMGLKMPWSWKLGRSTASERQHLDELLQSQAFPENTLFCADAGFVGYDCWRAILAAGHSFLIRVGSNVRLVQGLEAARTRAGLVYLWPQHVQRRREAPLVLRLLEFQGPRGKLCLVTNVLSERALPTRQAQQLYRLRWGVELQFRTLKQTFGRGKLRCRTAEHARLELEWSLVGLWLIQLYAAKEQIPLEHPPAASSVGLALDIMRSAMRHWNCRVASGQSCRRRLGQALRDNYRRTRPKQGRYRKNYKDKPSAKPPLILPATPAQIRDYQSLRNAA